MKYAKWVFLIVPGLLLVAFTFIKRTVSGTITDTARQPVPNAIVQEKGTKNAVSADANGKFTITIENSNAVLIITAAGYQQQEIKLSAHPFLSIVLQKSTQLPDKAVALGYGAELKMSAAGSVATLSRARGYSDNENYYDDHRHYNDNFNREGYDHIKENPFLKVKDNPLSTFSIDVDGASYSNIRRFLMNGRLPPDGAVRIEEMINYFSYKYPQPLNDAPFSINTMYAVCPWNEKHQLVSIGLQGKKIRAENLPPANLVFLIDVSGSMDDPGKLPLVQASMKLLVDQLRPQDKVAIVVYAGRAGLVLPATDGSQNMKIKDAIDRLKAGGSTAGGAGISLAYKIASENFLKNGNNRVVLCTDGDFNVGESSDDALERLIEAKRASWIYLTVLGFGTGNYQDAKMQKLADKGNGNHAYIDQLNEARRVLINQFGGTLFTIARDVKLQVEFNPAEVQGYRLIGYENRILNKEDFNDDQKDAGDLGSGHTVTALYEIIPVGMEAPELKKTDDLKYQKPAAGTVFNHSNEIMTIKLRYKKPDNDKSLLLQQVVDTNPVSFDKAGENLHLAAAVAQFGMLLRNSDHKGRGGYELAKGILMEMGKEDSIKELIQLMNMASRIKNNDHTPDHEISLKEPLIRFLKKQG